MTLDDMNELHGVIDVDDDNEPAPENIPQPGGGKQEGIMGNDFGHSGICPRWLEGAMNQSMKINFGNVKPTRLQLFELFFPKTYIQNVLLPETNKKIKSNAVSYGEFLVWTGLWLMMATIQGFWH